MRPLFPLVTLADTQKDIMKAGQPHFFQGGVGIVTDQHLVAAQVRVHGIEAAMDTHVREFQVDLAFLAGVEELTHFLQRDVASKTRVLFVAVLRRLARLAMRGRVIVGMQPSLVVAIQFAERENRARARLRFELPPGWSESCVR